MISFIGKTTTFQISGKQLIALLGIVALFLGINNLNSKFDFAYANPYNTTPHSIGYNPDNDPNVNPNLHQFDASWGDGHGLNYYDANHPLDPKRPCFRYLFSETPSPNLPPLSQTYKINEIPGIDHASSWEGANAISFNVNSTVYLPPSGYFIDQAGHQASILYLDDNSITVSYTASGTIAIGYVITIHRINVNPELKRLYNEFKTREKYVAIGALQVLGTANPGTIFYLRDTGAILDLRWQDDWWVCTNSIYTGKVSPDEIGKGIRITYGTCGNAGDMEGPLRPNPCENCDTLVPRPIEACGQPLTVETQTTVTCTQLSGTGCDENYAKRETWNTSVSIDTQNTKVPFAGWHDLIIEDNQTMNLNHYLNDYFEGTSLLDGERYDLMDPSSMKKLILEAGILRKITPLEIQDKLRKELILTGLNYEIYDGEDYTKDNPMYMSQWAEKPFSYPKGYFPPEKNDPNYITNYNNWMLTKWGRLWHRLPFFTREDAPGAIIVTSESNPGKLTANSSNSIQINDQTLKFPLAVPHLARLYQASNIINSILMPAQKDNFNHLLASSSNQTLNSQSNSFQSNTSQVLAAQNSCLNSVSDFQCSVDPVIYNYNPNVDSICCDGNFGAQYANYAVPVSRETYNNRCINRECTKCLLGYHTPSGSFVPYSQEHMPGDPICNGEDRMCYEWHSPSWTETMSRKLDISLEIPYLEAIWNYSTQPDTGFFNLFRPGDKAPFPNSSAVSHINFNNSMANINPNPAEIYFPYLGGIHQAKKCVSEQLLVPKDLQTGENHCSFWSSDFDYISGSSNMGVTQGLELNNLDCRNASYNISAEAKASAISVANRSWPNNILESRWDEVVTESKKHGWNPACVVALWIEESGGSHFSKASLGCLASGLDQTDRHNNLTQSMECFFSRHSLPIYNRFPMGSREWWLVYAEGPNNDGSFKANPNFPSNYYFWYERLIR
jgi:hypothetical protein